MKLRTASKVFHPRSITFLQIALTSVNDSQAWKLAWHVVAQQQASLSQIPSPPFRRQTSCETNELSSDQRSSSAVAQHAPEQFQVHALRRDADTSFIQSLSEANPERVTLAQWPLSRRPMVLIALLNRHWQSRRRWGSALIHSEKFAHLVSTCVPSAGTRSPRYLLHLWQVLRGLSYLLSV